MAVLECIRILFMSNLLSMHPTAMLYYWNNDYIFNCFMTKNGV